MQFSVGDKVVHPKLGAGFIRGLMDMGLARSPKQYYVIEIPSQGVTVYVPRHEAEGGAIRPVASESRLQLALQALRGVPCALPDDPVDRREKIADTLSTGRPILIAEALRDLHGHASQGRPSLEDRRLLSHAAAMLAAEVALVQGSDPAEVAEMIEATLRENRALAACGPDICAEH